MPQRSRKRDDTGECEHPHQPMHAVHLDREYGRRQNMTPRSRAAAIAALPLLLVLAAPAEAIDRPDRPAPVRPTRVSPTNLSQGECTQLGGTVSTETMGVCNSGKVCQTTDE